MKMEQNVPKRWHIKFRRRGNTQKKTYNIQNMAKVWNQKCNITVHLQESHMEEWQLVSLVRRSHIMISGVIQWTWLLEWSLQENQEKFRCSSFVLAVLNYVMLNTLWYVHFTCLLCYCQEIFKFVNTFHKKLRNLTYTVTFLCTSATDFWSLIIGIL
jgi:hypothetical protein